MNDGNHALRLDAGRGYFRNEGVNVMAFDDIYPEGHQSGVSILMHGRRIATCGDVRFEPTPGQWQPVPKQLRRRLDEDANAIVTELRYPDEEKSLRGMNPMIYPDVELQYRVTVRGEGDSAVIDVDLDRPVPEAFEGKLCFNLELFPGALFGKPWILDGQTGLFPRQPNGPVRARSSNFSRSGHLRLNESREPNADRERLAGFGRGYSPIVADDWIAEPYARGRALTICPDDDATRLRVECLTPETDLGLYDGRMNHNNGWFVVSSPIPAGRTEGALRWRITPNAIPGWRSPTVVQVSQVGYHPDQAKRAVLELDPETDIPGEAVLYILTPEGEVPAERLDVLEWGSFLRYRYCHPGSNTASFASGVGAKSATVAYGANRGDWSYIPGGVISGTALIRPDFPELLEYPFLWQQTEYVLGGGSSHFMFLVLAVQSLLRREERDGTG